MESTFFPMDSLYAEHGYCCSLETACPKGSHERQEKDEEEKAGWERRNKMMIMGYRNRRLNGDYRERLR